MISKVEGPSGGRGVSSLRKTGKTEKTSSSSFSQHLEEESVTAAGGVGAMQGVSSVGALIGIQEIEDATERAARGRKRATQILEQLEDMRVALLSGTLGKDQLLRLSAMVQNQKARVDDPSLMNLLDDIDLRARVELAKYGF